VTRAASAEDVREVLGSYVSRMTATSMARSAADRAGLGGVRFERLGPDAATLVELRVGIALFVPEGRRAECIGKLAALHVTPAPPNPTPAISAGLTQWSQGRATQEVRVRDENGIVDARTRVRALAAELGFEATNQLKIATAVSELSRNAFRYAGGGVVRFGPIESPRRGIFVVAEDEGPGIPNLSVVLSGAYRSKTGLGKGLLGCKRIMDEFSVDTTPGHGTTVTVRKYL
jgi:serine/threonine-protein kinase RsbT